MAKKKNPLKIIPLGGVNEIGKNMTVFEYGNEIMILDSGLAFPEDDLPGVDLVIQDITYLKENKEKIRGIVLTHGHEDHIGSLPYVLREITTKVYGTKLTIGLVKNKFKEHGISDTCLECISAGEKIKLGSVFEVEAIQGCHSIADSIGLAIRTPAGLVIHTGDFKVDYTPVDGAVIDLQRFAQLGRQGVLLLMADSTNAERPGYTMPEKSVGTTLLDLFGTAKGRIIIATFASNIHRLQQIFDTAKHYGRKVCVSGRSMENVTKVSMELGYLKVDTDQIIPIENVDRMKSEEVVIVTTGSQGEPMSALTRMANNEHRKLRVHEGDMIVISASPIPGNEKLISNVINKLYERGANVIYNDLVDIHVSGHACQEELKLMHTLVKPRFFIPVHGEYRHLKQHALIAESLGMNKKNIVIPNLGSVIELTRTKCVETGKVTAGRVFIDGLGVGDVGNIVLRDRRRLAQDGLMIVIVTVSKEGNKIIGEPDIVSRGFVYVKESSDLMDEAREVITAALDDCVLKQKMEWSDLKGKIREALAKYLYAQTGRKPMILPIIVEA